MSSNDNHSDFLIDKQTLLNYDFKQTIGKGTFGKVKLAVDNNIKEKVAVKILNKKQIESKNEMHLVQRELDILPKFNHVNVIKVNHILQDEENYYIIMEYCEKGELFDYIVQKRRLSEEEASNYFYQLINGVEHIHNSGVVHRDLKPENLLLTSNKTLKIIDFGLSNTFDGHNLLSTKCGSPSYAAPELIKGTLYDGFKTDIWCCGIILFAMVCGFLPFEGENDNELFRSILLGTIDYPPFVTFQTKQLIKELLNPDPSKRIDIPEIKKYQFYLKGKQNCNVIYEKNTMRNLHIVNSNNNIVDVNAFRKKILQINTNFTRKIDSINTKISKILHTESTNGKKISVHKHHPTQTTIQKINPKPGLSFSHVISPSETPTTTVSNIDTNKGTTNNSKVSLKSIIFSNAIKTKRQTKKYEEQYSYIPIQFTNRFNSPQNRPQVTTIRKITNRDKHFYMLPTEPKENYKYKKIHLSKINYSLNKNNNKKEENNMKKYTFSNNILPRLTSN